VTDIEPDLAAQARLQRLHDLVDDLRPLAGREALGRPFGEGHGLEQAMQAAFARLESADDARACGQLMAVDIIASTSHVPESMLAVMGATPEATARHQLPTDARAAIEGLGGAACTLLTQFGGPGSVWDLWVRRDDVVVEMLCWHTVARLRQATAGQMPEVRRP
jgi:hypothetical protein